MLKSKKNKHILFSLALLSLPCLSFADNTEENFTSNQEISLDGNIEDLSASKSHHHHRKTHDLTLRDFTGEWAFQVRSIGGVAGPTAVGGSVVVDGQVTFDSNGIGTINFGSVAIYSGIVGNLTTFTFTPGTQALTLTITDPIHAVGTLVINDPNNGYSETVDFIAIRGVDGIVVRFEGHQTVPTPITNAVTAYVFVRQNEF